ncbi:GntR family transcriptional regulator [Novosphingobium sp. KCTC 2891]|uniref:GntR family transcriptional regulator n=1 Tax=Novosphingobium sp. KCTC 2891 TaxID=2989730 RepID=UPI002222C20F|nr:GntR family transcriptional regulator [Novosphingobium sp. KCTC 2891]MCW1383595.1 GntR family transcriptional regulator [Novosphingobium sp. KCTC 2891]
MNRAEAITENQGESAAAALPKDTIQRLADGIIYCIRAGQMVPGQHLVEADLTRRFGVSRGSLREGLKHLAADGIVTLTRFRGAFISALDRKAVHDLLDVLEPLCALAARLAARHGGTDEQMETLRLIGHDLGRRGAGAQIASYLENRRRFYDLLIAMGGNTELGRVIPLTRTDLFRAQFDKVQTREQQKRHANGYARIAETVIARDPDRAEKAVRKHFIGTRATVDVLPEQAFTASYS